MTLLFIIGILLIILCVGCTIIKECGLAILCGFVGGYIISVTIWEYTNNNKPEAIDVYRGKTTLEITYRDNVPVDSVVVFKKED